MDSNEALTVLRLVFALAVLGYASVLDYRTRRVENKYWIFLSAAALVLFVAQVAADQQRPEYLLVLVPVIAVLSDVYWDAGEGTRLSRAAPGIKYGFAIASALVLAFVWAGEEYFLNLLAVPFMMLAIVVLYMLDVIRGGADAKALLALTILFPFHPKLASLPLIESDSSLAEVLFPFSFVVLVNAAILIAFVPLGFLARNAAAGDLRFPQALFGLREDLKQVRGRHAWLMERMDGGKHVLYTRPKQEEDLEKELDRLEEAGHTKVWITPKIPFLIPITVSLVLSTTVGNLILLLFPL